MWTTSMNAPRSRVARCRNRNWFMFTGKFSSRGAAGVNTRWRIDPIRRLKRFQAARVANTYLRPGVVWLGESLLEDETERVFKFLAQGECDAVIVVGTTAIFP